MVWVVFTGWGSVLSLTQCLLCCVLVCFLDTVFASRRDSVQHASKITATSDEMVLDPGQILHSASPDVDDTMFCGVVAFTWDVCTDILAVGQPHSADFTLGRVGFLWLQDHHLGDHPTSLWTRLQVWGLGSLHFQLRLLEDVRPLQLIDGGLPHSGRREAVVSAELHRWSSRHGTPHALATQSEHPCLLCVCCLFVLLQWFLSQKLSLKELFLKIRLFM